MKGIITNFEKNYLLELIGDFDGIKNQIDHLYRPDDNEMFQFVFEYLDREINLTIRKLVEVKLMLKIYRKRAKPINSRKLDKLVFKERKYLK